MDYADQIPAPVRRLVDRGVRIPCPLTVDIGRDVDPERIAPGVVIHAGCRLHGATTAIGPNSRIGVEAPASVSNCVLGRDVQLGGGSFAGSVFLDGCRVGSAAHIRPGCLLEEQIDVAHAIGLKQTVFLCFMTSGSLINFCDALMAGGTSRETHSEIGSSYVHFNYTPHGDKATPSLVGDVPRGVMLDQPPIFLGGQGGLVGPTRIAYGCVVPAGTILRKDSLQPGRLVGDRPSTFSGSIPYDMAVYRNSNRTLINNLVYVGNIRALRVWYDTVRRRLLSADLVGRTCLEGALNVLDLILTERMARLHQLAEKFPASIAALGGADSGGEAAIQQRFVNRWPHLRETLDTVLTGPADAVPDGFLSEWERIAPDTAYPEAVASLSGNARSAGSAWLQGMVDTVAGLWTP